MRASCVAERDEPRDDAWREGRSLSLASMISDNAGGIMERIDRYDAELKMFREPTREPQLAMLRFLRWMAEQGQLEHQVFGRSSGECAEALENLR
jgi:hypothetical protein